MRLSLNRYESVVALTPNIGLTLHFSFHQTSFPKSVWTLHLNSDEPPVHASEKTIPTSFNTGSTKISRRSIRSTLAAKRRDRCRVRSWPGVRRDGEPCR